MDVVHVVDHALVHGLDAAADHHGAPQLQRLIPAGQGPQLLNQLGGFLLGQKLGRKHRVGQQLELRQIKRTRADGVARVLACGPDDIAAELLQTLDVPVEAFPFCRNASVLQIIQQLSGGGGMRLVRVLLQILLDDQQLDLLVFRFRHIITSKTA